MKLFNKLICRSSNNSTSSTNAPAPGHSIMIGTNFLRDLLYSGYFRTNCKSSITRAIINLCASFSDYLCYHLIMQPPQWQQQAFDKGYDYKVRLPFISINGIKFRIMIICREYHEDRGGNNVTIRLKKRLNDEIDSTTFRFNYSLIVNHILVSSEQSSTDFFTWDHSKYKSRDNEVKIWCKTKISNIHSMALWIYPEIFDIRYKDKRKRFDKQAKLYRKLRYKWDINDETLKLFKTKQSTFISPCFGNWVLLFTPYESAGHCSLSLQLHSIPSLLGSFIAKIRFRYSNQGKEFQSRIEEREFGFSRDRWGETYTENLNMEELYWDMNELLSSEFFQMKSLYFIVDIEIIKVYAWPNANESLPSYQWESYNIKNRPYTNIEDDHEQKKKINIKRNSNVGPVQKYISTNGDTLQLILKKLDTMQARLTRVEDKLDSIVDD